MVDGYALVCAAMPQELLEVLRERFAQSQDARRGGRRNVLEVAEVRRAVEALRPLATRLSATSTASRTMRCVRAIVFDKTPGANWKVAWHQDRSLAVAAEADVAGWGPWSSKQGVVHVQPPLAVLERMITLRLHLDDCGEDNGPLRVLPGSHRGGFLTDEQIRAARAITGRGPTVLACRAGDVVAMRPLLLHASSPATLPARRRVVHLEFSPDPLPAPLAWRWEV